MLANALILLHSSTGIEVSLCGLKYPFFFCLLVDFPFNLLFLLSFPLKRRCYGHREENHKISYPPGICDTVQGDWGSELCRDQWLELGDLAAQPGIGQRGRLQRN